ncbi:hypothetical protein ACFC0R_07835 [Streptomyces sp. NPDC056086]|uniref:hypothetical protein n=1 Tax=Streptomyces sp. NPDC056086 TaxID=3345709 RepID=UPI0035DE5B68
MSETGTRSVTVDCHTGDFATGGGAMAVEGHGDLTQTFPVGTNPPTGWTATTTSNDTGDIVAYVVCVHPT